MAVNLRMVSPVEDTEVSHRSNGEEFEHFYLHNAAAAFALALSTTGDHVLAEDAVQEAMLRAWQAAPTFRPGNVRGWLLRIVARECIRLQRARVREMKRVGYASAFKQRDLSVCEGEERESRFSALRNALAKLPAAECNLLQLRYGEGLSQRKISATIAVPQQTISYRLQSAIGHLSKELVSAGLA